MYICIHTYRFKSISPLKYFSESYNPEIKPKLLACPGSPTLILCLVDPSSLYGFSSAYIIYRKCLNIQKVYRGLIFTPYHLAYYKKVTH